MADEEQRPSTPEATEEIPLEEPVTAQEPAAPSEHVANADADAAESSGAEHAEPQALSSSLQLENVPHPEPVQIVESSPSAAVTALDDTGHAASSGVDGEVPTRAIHAPDSPTATLITSLRSQLDLLYDQSQQLNAKLIDSISRHADLEDQVFSLQHERTRHTEQIDELERSKAQWEMSMNTGLLVERAQITAEMQRLAVGLVEEERRRGSAEERRNKVENEVDELAASLFDQANTMVAAERMGRVQAEERLRETEENLAAAEAAVRDMQQHLQSLPATGTGSPVAPTPVISRRFLSSHPPYAEFAMFLQNLRTLRPMKHRSKESWPVPLITTLLAQPFIARAIAEDHDPTLRLEAAPDLSWLSRRSVGAAIIAGDLVIEPVSAMSVIANTSGSVESIGCSLCGKPVFAPAHIPSSPAGGALAHRGSASRFSLKPFFASPGSSSVPQSPLSSPALGPPNYSSVYVFHVVASQPGDKDTRSYPLCKSGWCLERLRATCALWHFIRTGIIHVVWHCDDGTVDDDNESTPRERTVSASSAPPFAVTPETPGATQEAPPRRKSGWGLGFKIGGGGGSSERSNSGGWSKSWTKATPPASPRPGSAADSVEAKDAAAASESSLPVVVGLGAPLELKTDVRSEVLEKSNDVSPLSADPVSVDGVPAANDEGEGEATPVTAEASSPTADGLVAPLTTSHPGSSVSLDSDAAAFSTPNAGTQELPEDVEATPSASADVAPTVDLSSPSEPAADRVPDPAAESATEPTSEPVISEPVIAEPVVSGPPPLPKRAAARNQATQPGSSTPTPPEPSTPIVHALDEAGEPLTTAEQNGEEGEHASRPPPLPPRHPHTPIAQVRIDDHDAGVPRGTEKTFLTGESWDVRAWRQVIRFKEDMWRARVGVSEEDD